MIGIGLWSAAAGSAAVTVQYNDDADADISGVYVSSTQLRSNAPQLEQ